MQPAEQKLRKYVGLGRVRVEKYDGPKLNVRPTQQEKEKEKKEEKERKK